MVQVTLFLLLSSTTIALASFGPNVRIHQERPGHACLVPAIAVGPGAPSRQPIYVVYEDDSLQGMVPASADLVFQKSTDAGATWLTEDKLVHHGKTGLSPDVTTDPDGNLYIVYTGRDTANWGHYYCVRSTDGGVIWSEPVQVDDNVTYLSNLQWARVATDSAGNLFCAWPDVRNGKSNIWSSTSTDRGETWGAGVRVGNDTTRDFYGFADVDVSVQPGTNQYLVSTVCRYYASLTMSVVVCAYLYRSTDGGLTFQPGVRLDTFSRLVADPHVVADPDHIICSYTGNGEASGHGLTESRTFYAGRDTWGGVVAVSDTMLNSYYHGGKLALSSDGRVHTVLMVYDRNWRIHYVSSSDHGASWSPLTLVSDGGSVTQYPDIGVDSEGYVYVVWCDLRNGRNEIWFSTNNPAGIAEQPVQQPVGARPIATIVRNVLLLPEATSPKPQTTSLMDASGRKVLNLKSGANDVRALAPGVYFVREEPQASSFKPQAVRKIVVTR
jgi:hypothetical protein